MSSAGAKAALQGFRVQALYTLALMLEPGAENLVFQPEGKEDLDVYAGDELKRVIQVKGHADPLSLSKLGHGQDDSFLRRASELCARAGLEIVVATFGPVGPELEGAWAGTANHRASVVTKLRDGGFDDEKIANLFASVRFEQVSEVVLRQQVFDFLSESLLGGDPESAFDLLVAWLYQAAEGRRRITTADLRDRITRVGRYLAERAAHHQEWFTSIVPLDDAPITLERREELAIEYHRGVAARFDHITTDQDILREAKLQQIDEAFSASKVVIVHGASGQGKSTLGLRYLHDFVPAAWRFSIRLVADRTHALRVATALAGHLRAVAAPMYVYVDVSPRDADWPELVRVLVEQAGVKVLVTIREEDLARVNISESELGFPRSVQIQFDEAEAQLIYDKLVARRPADRFLSFPEAWAQFGGQGPLLEFTYLVTQSESLEATLRAQVRRLRDEVQAGRLPAADLAFLRLVSVSAAYEARLDVAGLAAVAGLPDPVRTLELLESEYLVRRSAEGRYVEGLHPIRSTIMAAALTDPVFAPWAESAAVCIQHMPEPDLEAFLFHGFLHHQDASETLIHAAKERRLRTWAGLAGVGRSLIWLGVKRYVDDNHAVIEEGREKLSTAWSLLLDFDVADIVSDEEPFIERLPGARPEVVELGRQLRERQSNKREIFALFSTWISNIPVAPDPPATTADWTGLAELCFWAARLEIAGPAMDAAWDVDLAAAIESVPLPVLSRVVQAWSYGPPERFQERVQPHTGRLLSKYRETMQVVSLESEEDRLYARFIVPWDVMATANTEANEEKSTDRLHDFTTQRIDLLRQLAPGRERYGAKGYGHRNPLIVPPYDSTEKDGVLSRYLLPEWGPALNGTFINLADRSTRPETWRDYAEGVMGIRQRVIVSLNQLRKGLGAHFRSERWVNIAARHLDTDAWNAIKAALDTTPKLPRSAVDGWGFANEGRERRGRAGKGVAGEGTGGVARARVNLALDKHRPLVDATRAYFNPLSNFFGQANGPLTLNSLLGRARSEDERTGLRTVATKQGVPTDNGFLSAYNFAEALRHLPAFQKEFRTRFSSLVGARVLDRIEQAESDTLSAAWVLWHAFVTQPERRWKAPEMKAGQVFSEILDRLRNEIRGGLAALADEGVHASIHSEQVLWEDEPTLWLLVEAENPLRMLDATRAVADVVQGALGDIGLQSTEQFAVDTAWQSIILVPTTHGESTQGAVLRFRPYHFYAGSNVHESSWPWFPVPFPGAAAETLGVSVRKDGPEQLLERLQQSVVELWSIVAHTSDFTRLPDDVDEDGIGILQRYLAGVGDQIDQSRKRVWDVWFEALKDIYQIPDWTDRPLLVEVHNALLDLRDVLMPAEGHEPGDAVDLGTLSEWRDRIQEILPTLEAMRLVRLADAHGITDL
ncbi:hypothetical protein [Longimicrobium terrae]|uniref:Uncharacterized protein n=1 Tax=Longimicrobium terrae TaxID=1639882 RepID=A0A841GXD3_9BACT|nr:hypothetical protein [Longimicrobium terrae]MBB4635622.1 hypothetical protein [Longimicrobium terrae]MBB6070016.1 hypothetical protein [Longimicrobium terrae]NNC32926.1 hypothetical protein [Longimicrobium terrae]